MKLVRPLLDLGDDGDQNGDQIVGFVEQRLQPGGRYDLGVGQQFQPIGSFVQFLQAALDFADKAASDLARCASR